MIRAIIFDCFGVLTASDKWKQFATSLPKEQHETASKLNRQLDSGKLTQQQFFQEIHKLTGKSPELVENIINHEMNKNTELLSYIKELKKGFKIGILSNISSNWIRDSFLTLEEQELFDDIVLSFEVGATKPDRRIYKTAAERLKTPIRNCVLVDDSPYNIAGAEAAGMQTILYQNFTQLKNDLEKILHSS